jgi:hypothetical protein
MKAATLMAGTLLVSGVCLAGCDEGLSTLAGPTPDLQPTFSSIQQHVFESTDAAGRSLCTGCHTDQGRTPAGGLNLRREMAHGALVGVRSGQRPDVMRVAAGDPGNSYLVHKLEGHPQITGQRMPRTGGPYLTDGQMMIVRRWIERGAPND